MEHMHASHDLILVLFSYVIAAASSYTVLDLAARVGEAKASRRWKWLVFGSVLMGMGIWSAHFIGMLALNLSVPVKYNLLKVLLSIVVAVLASFIALATIDRCRAGIRQMLGGGILLAAGIAGMHYIGMSAMQIGIMYRPGYVVLSVAVAYAAAVAALRLSLSAMAGSDKQGGWRKLCGGLVLGAAIAGMHYTGMLAAQFVPEHLYEDMSGVVLEQKWLAYLIAGGMLLTLWLSLIGLSISRRFSHKDTEILVNEKWYRSLYEHNQDGILSVDLDLRIIGVNPAASRITGISQGILQERSLDFFLNIVLEEDRGRMHELFSRSFGGEHVSYETTIIHQEGHHVDISVINAPVTVDGQVVGTYVIARDVTEDKRAKERNHYLAFHDELTGLPNRRMFNQLLEQAIETHSGKREPFGVMVLDLDRFKMINDSLGHLYGDMFLKEMSSRIRNSVVNENVVLARLGGDEFALLCRFTRKQMNATDIAESMIAAVTQPYHLKEREFYATMSIGIAFFPYHGEDPVQLLKNADTAMYEVKKNGKNDYHFFSEELNGELLERLELEGDLRRALERDEFVLHYQPQVREDRKAVVGVEALVRWQHPRRGLLSPGVFIPLAEEMGLIVELGQWVLREACRQMRRWHEAGGPLVPVAVNLSSQQFHQYNLLEEIMGILEESGLAPEYLELEITESMMMNAAISSEVLSGLAKTGIRISLDDFGTGYSSLSYLRLYPIHKVKIDRSFIRDIVSNKDDRAIVAAIITLARHLKMEVIAEGIETREQLGILLDKGCREFQGYYYSRPLPAHEIAETFLLAARTS
ncbi:EAL domain-containing protein [Paenibacillus tepidiphilus]|uniref:bifunctional diguanylate cyclase/phosphodiesterase n=1 Tax=Paenibacillus tepidiphilus TaxID=2608683 RepID=UPI00123902F7|nr:EAL domain-containing protein [Paenibacillus tepidiphilus]